MSVQSLKRWSGILLAITAVVFAIAAVAVAIHPMTSALPPLTYYVGLVLIVPTLTAIYGIQAQHSGRLGLAGYLLGVVGASLYSAPNYALLAGVQGASAWHDIWAFAMGNTLPVGASSFLLGTIMLGVVTWRAGAFPRWSGALLAAGAALWLVAFWVSITPLLTAGTLLLAGGLGWIGWSLLMGKRVPQAAAELQSSAA